MKRGVLIDSRIKKLKEKEKMVTGVENKNQKIRNKYYDRRGGKIGDGREKDRLCEQWSRGFGDYTGI
ncbi:MAG: hypothetical protein LUG47_01075 [Clostridiales bacterium]|nr:hypothetical protein [Clostridiales bacterium]